MAEQDLQGAQGLTESVGARLRLARAAAGLSRADVAARTKIAERHLIAIEADSFGELASSTYAVGFSRAYARAVGLDEAEIARAVRLQIGAIDEPAERRADNFEPGDPARIPGSRTAWLAGIGAVAVIAAVFTFWGSYYAPAVSLPDLAKPSPSSVPSAIATVPPPAAAPARAPVVFTALEQGVWVKFYDAAGNQLMQKQMALGESYTVPAEANGPMLRTARPDALRITIGGREVPRLSDRQRTMADVPVTASALLARDTAPAVARVPTPAPAAQSAVAPSPRPAPPVSTAPRVTSTSAPSPVPEPRTTPAAETPRAVQPAPAPSPSPPAAAPAEPSTVSQ